MYNRLCTRFVCYIDNGMLDVIAGKEVQSKVVGEYDKV